MPSRRAFLAFFARASVATSLFGLASARHALAASVQASVKRWLQQVDALTAAAKDGALTALQWQSDMAYLCAQLDVASLVRFIDLDALSRSMPWILRGESIQTLDFQEQDDLPRRVVGYRLLAGMRRGRSIPPHGHDNLLSAFVTLRGRVRARHFERRRDVGGLVYIEPCLDTVLLPGQGSQVSDARHNVHGFTALEDHSFLFDVGVSDLSASWRPAAGVVLPTGAPDPAMPNRVYLDIDHHRARWGDSFAVARIGRDEAYRLYG